MATNEEIRGVDLIVKAGSTIIGGQDDATLNFDPSSNEVNSKTLQGWRETLAGLIGWSVDVSGFWYEGTPSGAVDGFGASLGIGTAGSGTYDPLAGLSTLTISLNLNTYERSNQDHGGFIVQAPDLRSATIEAEADYVDPNATEGVALDTAMTAFLAGNEVDFQASFGESGSTLSGTGRPMPSALSGTSGDDSTITFTIESTGAVTNGVTGADSGITNLLDAFFADPITQLNVEIGVRKDASQPAYTPEHDKYSGSVWPSTLDITIPANGPIETSATLGGSSELTREMVPVP